MQLDSEEIRGASLEDLIAEASAAGLPIDDLRDGGRMLVAYRDDAGSVVGYGGLEPFGRDALLRSIVVKPHRRGDGHGRAIVHDLLSRAAHSGAREVWLLTTTAERFFAALGFAHAARHEAPTTIRGSREFSSLCPASASLMRRHVVLTAR